MAVGSLDDEDRGGQEPEVEDDRTVEVLLPLLAGDVVEVTRVGEKTLVQVWDRAHEREKVYTLLPEGASVDVGEESVVLRLPHVEVEEE